MSEPAGCVRCGHLAASHRKGEGCAECEPGACLHYVERAPASLRAYTAGLGKALDLID